MSDILDRQALVENNLNRVSYLAKKRIARLPRSIELNDLISYGTMGLISASEKYDPSKKLKFITYAGWKINSAMSDGLRSFFQAKRVHAKGKLQVTIRKPPEVSIDDVVIPSHFAYTPERIAERHLTAIAVRNAVASLPYRHRRIVYLYDLKGITMRNITKELGVTETRISQLRTEALKMLRDKLQDFQ